MELTPSVIEGFVNACLIKNFDQATETPDFHRELWNFCCHQDKFVAIAAPRGHGKSTAVTYAYLLAEVLFRKSRYVLIVSDSFSQAGLFLGDVIKELRDNEDIHGLFGGLEFIKSTEDDIICKFDDGYTFRIQAKGSEQKLRGLKWLNKRPDLIICDDMESDEQVLNKERREKFRRWFYSALIPCLSVSGKIRIVGTILHLDALLERLMPESQLASLGSKGLKHLVTEDLKQYTGYKTPWTSIKYRAHTDDFNKILWPARWDKQALIERRNQYVMQGLADAYSQEMLNIPLDDANGFFKKNDFAPLKDEDRKKNLNYYIAADLAISQRQHSDYSVFAVAGMDDEQRLQCVNIIRDRMDAMQIVDTILALQRTYKPELFGIEAGTIQKSIGPYLNEAMLKSDVFVNLVLLKPSGDKLSRARSMQARMRAGAVKFDKNSDWYQTFEDELMRFPRDRHDDQVDAWAYIGLLLDQMQVAATPQELEDEEYRFALHEYGHDQIGRSVTTGY
jgi:predicted phage terminase large subunit-like protein